MKRCPVCKTIFPEDANFCPMDARQLEDVPGTNRPGGASLDLPTMQARLVGARYKLGPQIGGKRTGEVFAGEDLSNGQACAVKLVAPAVFPTPLVAQRTERELKQLMKVPSERIARIIEVGKQQERLFIAMELVSGVTLAEILATQGPLGAADAARLGVEIGEGLAEAAKLGVIHRDVAPKNVMVVADSRGQRRVKLLNFGVPTPVTDKVLGIPDFLSPEQAEGKPVDQRSNIYSMGTLLYTMLTGAPPFAGTPEEILRQQVVSPVTPPSQKGSGRDIPAELERLILRAMEKASSRRHLTLRQLLGDLEGIAGHLPASDSIVAPVVPPPAHAPPRSSSSHTAQPRPSAQIVAQPEVPHAPPPPTRRERHSAAKTMVGIPFHPSMHEPAASGKAGAAPPAPVQVPPPATPVAPVAPVAIEPPVVVFSPPKHAPEPEPARSSRRLPSEPAAEPKKTGQFRETLWFKKGEAENVPLEGDAPAPGAGELPIEDRYKDDGTITAADRDRLSLRAGEPAARKRGPVVPGEQMGDADLARELRGGNNRLLYIVGGAAVVILLVIILVWAFR